MYKYSPSTKGFYLAEIHGTSIPSDAVEVSETRYSELMAGQNLGQAIAYTETAGVHLVVVTPQVYSLTKRQAREYLIRNGTIDYVTAAIDAIVDGTDREVTRNYWEHAQDFEIDHPVLVQLASALGITDLQTVFNEASQL